MKNICFYHDDSDGIMSAAIVLQNQPDTECIPVQHGYDEEEFVAKYKLGDYQFIFVVDFSFTKDIMHMLKYMARGEFVWIDHHQSAMDKLVDLWFNEDIGGLREIGKSGCLLTWEWFNPHDMIPSSVCYINDYDLWLHKLKNTKAFHEYFCLEITKPEEALDYIKNGMLEAPSNEIQTQLMIQRGKFLMKAKQARIEKVFKNGYYGLYHGKKGYWVNSAHDTSDLGNYILEQDYEVAVIYFDKGNKRIYSLRSKGDLDVSVYAKIYDGGGHKNAAGYQTSRCKDFNQEE